MDLLTIGIGLAMVFFSIGMTILRTRAPEKLGKLKAMKNRFGDETGMIVHISAYTILPFVAGFLLAFAGLNGLSLFNFF